MVFPLLIAAGAFVAENAIALGVVGGSVAAGATFGNAFGKKTGENSNTLLIIAAIAVIAFFVLRKRKVV